MSQFISHHGTAQTSATASPMRQSFEDDHIAQAPRANPFATPYGSTPGGSRDQSRTGSSTGLALPEQRYFHSRR
ncbi:hypothetical protein LTS18_001481, partial [Coniosporium uncinatum]